MGGDTPVESRLLTGANGLPNNRPSSMHHRSFDRIAAPLSRWRWRREKGREKKKKKGGGKKWKENNNSPVYISADIFVPSKRKRMIRLGKKLSYSKIRILFSPRGKRGNCRRKFGVATIKGKFGGWFYVDLCPLSLLSPSFFTVYRSFLFFFLFFFTATHI